MSNVGNWIGQRVGKQSEGLYFLGDVLPGHSTYQNNGDDTYWYAVIDGDNREAGIGEVSGNTFTRTQLYSKIENGVYEESPALGLASLSNNAVIYCTFNKAAFDQIQTKLIDVLYSGDNVSELVNDAGYLNNDTNYAKLDQVNNFQEQPEWDSMPLATENYVDQKSDAVSGVWDWIEATSGNPGIGNFGSDIQPLEDAGLFRLHKTTASGEQISGDAINTDDKLFIVAHNRVYSGVYTVVNPAVDQTDYVEIPVIFSDGRGGDPASGDRFWVAWVPQGVGAHHHDDRYYTETEVDNLLITERDNNPANIVWDVDIPFSPAKLINKLDGPLTFERASESTVINRSGIVETVAIDEPALGKDGIGIFEAVTNEFLWSEDFSKNNWIGGNTTQSVSGTETFNGKPVSVYTVNTVPDVNHFGPRQGRSFTAGVYTCIYILKPKELGIIQFGSSLTLSPNVGYQLCRVDFRDGTVLTGVEYIVALQKLENGFWLFAHKFEVEVSASSVLTHQIFSNNDEQIYTGNGTDGIYYYAAQLTKTSFLPPYIPTTDTLITRALDKCSIPMSGNMPSDITLPFTIIADCSFPKGGNHTLVRPQNYVIYIRRFDGNDHVMFYLGGSLASFNPDELLHRYIFRWDGVTRTIFMDGVKKASSHSAIDTSNYDFNERLYIGSDSGSFQYLNSYIRNFKILHRALTDQEVAALGGPQ